MKLLSFEAYNKQTKVRVNRIDFQSFSLLVGASGVGKTQILNAIHKLKSISSGSNESGFCWDVNFEIDSTIYSWSGEFDTLEGNEFENPFSSIVLIPNDEDSAKAAILTERLIINGTEIVSRDKDNITFNGELIVRLNPNESVISLLKQEPEISKVKKAFSQIVSMGESESGNFFIMFAKKTKDIDAKFESVDALRNSEISLLGKLYSCQETMSEYFSNIVSSYIDIFPFVEGVRVHKFDDDTAVRGYVAYVIGVKERGVDHWINQESMSSGMIKTLTQIAYLHLCPKGTVFLIDEFENGFGVNCINDITEVLMNTGDGIQFIITSHHPYIINNVSVDNWKIISRKAGEIKSFNADVFKLKESNHEAFTKLINLDIYSQGADIE